jgi:hypothetical protein
MSAIGQIAGGLIQSGAAGAAAGQIAAQDQKAIAGQQAQYQTTSNNINPYIQTGTANLPTYGNYYNTTSGVLGGALANAQTAVNNIGTSSMADLEATPGYQFQLQQGQQAAKAAASALGLGNSGAIGKGLTNYANGLAASNYQNIYNQQMGNAQAAQNQVNAAGNVQNSIYNQLAGTVNTGLSAAGTLGQIGQQSQDSISSLYGNIGKAQAAGTIGAANGIAGAVGGAGQALGNGLFSNGQNSFSSMASNFNNNLSGLSSMFGGGSPSYTGGDTVGNMGGTISGAIGPAGMMGSA